MKTRLVTSIVAVAVVGGMTLFLGCGAESTRLGIAAIESPDSTVAAAIAPATTESPPAPVVPPPAVTVPAPPQLSPGVDEIVKLAQAGVGDEVLQAYIENSSVAYQLNVDEILYLHDLGLSAETIGALVRHSQSSQNPSTALAGANGQPSTNDVSPKVEQQPEAQPTPPRNADDANPANAYAVTPPQEVNNNYFYQTLAPYGSWVEVADYGWCWQPTVAVVDVGWRPYCNRGRWLWSDCGWYWQSDYSWGWAPFHYGRWQRSPTHGWVWLPGQTWAPAWVTWRYSDSYCGWAPLPPGAHFDVGVGFRFHTGRVGVGFDFGLASDCYTFIPTSYVCDRTPWYHCLPRSQVINVFNHTTVINNYTTGPGHHGIVNVGPGTDAIARVTRSEIRKVTLRDVNPARGTLIKADRLERDGRALAVFRPNLPQQASAPPPEITRRQQEFRKQSESLARSGAVRTATAANDRKTLVAPSNRASSESAPSVRGTPWVAPKAAGHVPTPHASDGGNSRQVVTAQPQRTMTPTVQAPAISANPRSERRSSGGSQSAPLIVRPSPSDSAPRPLAEVAPGTIDIRNRERGERAPVYAPQTSAQPEFRGQPIRREPGFQPYRSESVSPPTGAQTITPPVNRQEGRTFELPPANSPGASVITPRAAEPRQSAPAYQPPQRFSAPPQTGPSRVIEAPVARPSSPPPAASPPPAVSRPQPAPSSAPSQSRGDTGRKR
jgi:hypothetical protein